MRAFPVQTRRRQAPPAADKTCACQRLPASDFTASEHRLYTMMARFPNDAPPHEHSHLPQEHAQNQSDGCAACQAKRKRETELFSRSHRVNREDAVDMLPALEQLAGSDWLGAAHEHDHHEELSATARTEKSCPW